MAEQHPDLLAALLEQYSRPQQQPAWESPLSFLGSGQKREPSDWAKANPEWAAFLSKIPMAFGALQGRAPAAMLRRQDTALRPLTAAELELAALYRRVLNPEPLNGPRSEPAPREPGAADPPSFYEFWANQGRR